MGHRRLLVAVALGVLFAGCGGGSSEVRQEERAPKGFDPKAARALERTLDEQFENSGVPGISATVIVEGRGEWSATRGLADVRAGRKVTTATPFCQGSITKLVVAALALRLTEQGRISLDQPLGRLVKRVPEGAAEVSLRRLLAQST